MTRSLEAEGHHPLAFAKRRVFKGIRASAPYSRRLDTVLFGEKLANYWPTPPRRCNRILPGSLGAWPAACLALRSQQLAEARVVRQRLQVDVGVQVDAVRRPACKRSAQVVQRVVVLAE